jgi:hypothetical protein
LDTRATGEASLLTTRREDSANTDSDAPGTLVQHLYSHLAERFGVQVKLDTLSGLLAFFVASPNPRVKHSLVIASDTSATQRVYLCVRAVAHMLLGHTDRPYASWLEPRRGPEGPLVLLGEQEIVENAQADELVREILWGCRECDDLICRHRSDAIEQVLDEARELSQLLEPVREYHHLAEVVDDLARPEGESPPGPVTEPDGHQVAPTSSLSDQVEFVLADQAAPSPAMSGRRLAFWTAVVELQNLAQTFREAPPDAEPILLAMQGAEDLFYDSDDLLGEWEGALGEILQRGWRVERIWNIHDDARRNVELVHKLMGFTARTSGTLRPRYFPDLTPRSPWGVLILPGLALEFDAAEERARSVDRVARIQDPRHIDRLRARFRRLREETDPLVETYAYDNGPQELAFEEKQADREACPGDRLLVQHHLSVLTHPISWYDPASPWTVSTGFADEDRRKLFAIRRRRIGQLDKSMKEGCKYRDVVARRAIDDLVRQNGQYHPKHSKLPHEECRKYLEHLITLLERYGDGYAIALVEPRDEEKIFHAARDESGSHQFNAWLVKNSHTVMMERTIGKRAHAIFIEERTVASAFNAHFHERVWRNIGDDCTSNDNVIRYLKDRLEDLSSHRY